MWGSLRLAPATRVIGYRLLDLVGQVKRLSEYTSPRSTGEDYVVCRATSKEDFDFIEKLTFIERSPSVGVHSVVHMAPVVKPGFFIGYLNGRRISQACVIRYSIAGNSNENSNFYYGGFYCVDKPYRTKGYGLKLIEVMVSTVPEKCTLGIDSFLPTVPQYEKPPLNGRKEWLCREYIVSCSKVVEELNTAIKGESYPAQVKVNPIVDVDFEKLFEYDTSVFGFPRRDFLKKWITIPESLGWAVTNSSENVVGYSVIQHSFLDKHQIVGPLFSDDTHIAWLLLHKAAEAAIEQKSAEKLVFWSPVDVNHDFIDMIETKIGYEHLVEAYRMYRNGVVPLQVHVGKMKVLTSPNFG